MVMNMKAKETAAFLQNLSLSWNDDPILFFHKHICLTIWLKPGFHPRIRSVALNCIAI